MIYLIFKIIFGMQTFAAGYYVGDQKDFTDSRIKMFTVAALIQIAGILAVPVIAVLWISGFIWKALNYFELPFIIKRVIFKIPIKNFNKQSQQIFKNQYKNFTPKWYQVRTA